MRQTQRYHIIIVCLHWVMALCLILMLASGLIMGEFISDKSLKFQVYQWHKSLGVLLLIAAALRVLARLMSKAPKLPDTITSRDQVAAKLGHLALYGFMIAMPLSGWLMVSSSVYGLPTVVFNMFTWPHFPGVAGSELVNGASKAGHEYLAYAFIVMIVLHIAAVVIHKKKEGINLLKRMSFRG